MSAMNYPHHTDQICSSDNCNTVSREEQLSVTGGKSVTCSRAPSTRIGALYANMGAATATPEAKAGISVLDMKPGKIRAGVATSCSSQVQQPRRPLPTLSTAITFTGSPKTFSDRVATVYGSEGWGFERLPARQRSRRSGSCHGATGEALNRGP